MVKPSFQIVIPTLGGRERYARFAIASCLEQDYPRVGVIVSNNGAAPGVRECAAAFRDDRIRYVQTESLLPMAAHWEFAVSHADADFVCMLGDDDALTPSCLTQVASALEAHPGCRCVVHRPAQYYWPDYPVDSLRNRYSVGAYSRRVSAHPTRDILQQVSVFREWYGQLPFLYHGFVSGALVRGIQGNGRRLFAKIAPDIYSDLLLAYELESFVRIDYCLTVGGQGAKSNGANVMLDTEDGRKFYQDLPEYLRPRREPRSVYLQLFEYVEELRARYQPGEPWPIDWLRFGAKTINEAVLATRHRRAILDGLGALLRERCPQPHRSALLAAIGMLSIAPFRRAAEWAVERRQRRAVSAWRDAAADFGSATVLDVARSLDWACRA